ncbi:pectin esterase [Arthrobacter sp. JZ12]|nr:pectin esterase [Arthrobacter sp. JZ12]
MQATPGAGQPTLHVVGDSTASTYAHRELPRAGWGQALPLALNSGSRVVNIALSGASSKSYTDSGLAAEALSLLAPGDYLLISFGHNDEKVTDPARGTLPGSTYKEYLRGFIDGARAAGALPILVTPVERRRFDPAGNARRSHGQYPAAMRELASATGTPLIDLEEQSLTLWQELGPEGTRSMFLHAAPGEFQQYPDGVEDNTHFRAEGALAVAGLVAHGLQELGFASARPAFRGVDAESLFAGIFWPSERPLDQPVVLDVGPGARFSSVQAAVDAVPENAGTRHEIRIAPGEYRELILVPRSKPLVSFRGTGSSSSDVVLVYNNASGTSKPDGSGTYGTSGSASVRIDASDFEARNLTFSNDFDEAANAHIRNRQAVALHVTGDRCVFNGVRVLGNQDSLLVNTPNASTVSRHFFVDSYVEGDVDFIFGRATAVFQRCVIQSLNRGSSSNNGYVTAGSINQVFPFGYLFDQCRFESAAARATVYLGRPWHPSGDPQAIAQVLVRDSHLGAHIKSAPWTDMSGFSWRDARFHEFHNSGPGSAHSPDRPQMTVAQAAGFTASHYLRGPDWWQPQLADTAADTTIPPAGR